MSETDVSLGGSLTVGKVIVDPREIKGTGGWHNPYLHIPIKIQLYPTINETPMALVRLTASLHLTEQIDINNQLGMRVSYDQLYNLSIVTPPQGTAPSNGGAQLLFPLTHEQIKLLEDLRHQPNSKLYLRIEPVMARMRDLVAGYYSVGDRKISIGPQTTLAYLSLAAIGTISLEMSEMKWAESILPEVGYDRFRLVEIALPSSSRLVPNDAIAMFENARKDYDTLIYNGCVEKCRFVIEIIERHLVVQNHKLGNAVARELGWPTGRRLPDQAKFLNFACTGNFRFTSAAHHYPSTTTLLPADAHTALVSIATLLEYLGQLR